VILQLIYGIIIFLIKCFLEEFDKEENVAVTGAATAAYYFKRRL
jgi:hypothetical protein